MEIIDFHSHLQPSFEARDALLAKMAEVGIRQAIVVPGGVTSPVSLSQQMQKPFPRNILIPNEAVRSLCDDGTNRLLPFYFATPMGDAEEYECNGMKYYGLKLGPAVHGVPLTDSRYRPFLQIALKLKHSVYLHCLQHPGFDVKAVVELACRYPDLNFILGHAGIGNCDFASVKAIQNHSNIYFETSGGFSSVISFANRTLGSQRIVFGSEYPLQAPELEIQKMRLVNIGPNRLNETALKLLGKLHD